VEHEYDFVIPFCIILTQIIKICPMQSVERQFVGVPVTRSVERCTQADVPVVGTGTAFTLSMTKITAYRPSFSVPHLSSFVRVAARRNHPRDGPKSRPRPNNINESMY